MENNNLEPVINRICGRLDALEKAVEKLTPKPHQKKNGSRPASYEELEDYVVNRLKLKRNDAAALWEHWMGNGFTNSGKPIASWRATASDWERRKVFFPSLQR